MPFLAKTDLKNRIANGQTELVLDCLSELVSREANGVSENDLILIRARFYKLKKDTRAKAIGTEEKQVSIGQINRDLLDWIDELPVETIEISESLYKKWNTPGKSTMAYSRVVIVLILVVVALYLADKCCIVNLFENGATRVESDSSKTDTLVRSTDSDLVQVPGESALPETKPLPVVNLKFGALGPITSVFSKYIIGSDTFPIAYLDSVFIAGREAGGNTLLNACYFQFNVQNPSDEKITLRNVFVRLLDYREIPKNGKHLRIQPFTELPVAYILMGSSSREGANVYPNLFYLVDGERKKLGIIQLPPRNSEDIAVRVNARERGIYTFKLGVEYFSSKNDSLISRFVSPDTLTWVFEKGPK